MNKVLTQCFIALLLLVVFSCSKNSPLEKMEQIKIIGNDNPKLALAMLDSVELDIRQCSEFVQHKYDLLRIRLNDKAVIPPIGDIKIKELIKYFENEGTVQDKQEVFYYAGSVYRDLQDTPRALEYFYKSMDYAECIDDCDSIMIRNTYSNLHYLLYGVQNYMEAVSMAKEELRISQKLGFEDVVSYMHVGAAYKAVDSVKQSIDSYNKAFRIIEQAHDKSQYQEDIIRLLMDYSIMNEISKAQLCIPYINDEQTKYLSILRNIAFARFYEACEKNDSAIICCKQVLHESADLNNMYDAAKQIYRIYYKQGKLLEANYYAVIYMQLSDSLDFGKRQELAATVNNAYKYHLDERKEHKLKEDKNRYRLYLVLALFSSFIIVILICMFYIRKRNLHLKRMVELSFELKRVSEDDKQLREEIARKEKELLYLEESLETSNKELAQIKNELERVNTELSGYNNVLKEKELLLSEKMEQNKAFIKLLHQTELENRAEDVILAVRQSAIGKKNMTSADWNQLYHAVDELYPDFKDILLEELGSFTEQQMQLCYLMRIGLAKKQIQNLTNLSRVTVWRWTKKYAWASCCVQHASSFV